MKQFDRRYFDKWYRDPKHRIGTRADLLRQVNFAIAAAEYMLARPVRTVLDVGAGEGRWQPLVASLRPKARYTGIDPSEYSVKRYGTRRNIIKGTFDDLETLFSETLFDVVVCCSVLNYLPKPDFIRAIQQLAARTQGVAFLEIFTSDDDIIGDLAEWHVESPAAYRKLLRDAGFTPCGMHCYVTSALPVSTVALEQA